MGFGLRDAARRLGISHVGLKKAADVGRAPRLDDGTFDLAAVRASEWWRSKVVEEKPQRQAASPVTPPANVTPKPKGPTISRLSELSKVDIEKLVLAEKKERLRLANEKEKGSLIDRQAVEAKWAEVGVKFRDSLMGLPVRVCNRVPAEWRRELAAVLEDEARKVLTALSDEIRTDSRAA